MQALLDDGQQEEQIQVSAKTRPWNHTPQLTISWTNVAGPSPYMIIYTVTLRHLVFDRVLSPCVRCDQEPQGHKVSVVWCYLLSLPSSLSPHLTPCVCVCEPLIVIGLLNWLTCCYHFSAVVLS